MITRETLASINQRALASVLAERLEIEHMARAIGKSSPLLDRAERIVEVSLVEVNAANFVAECDMLGIESQADDSERAGA